MELGGTAALSGLFAALVAVSATRAIEVLGGLAGGVLASIPTTIIPASLGFTARLQGPALAAAMHSIPSAMLANAVFLLQWRIWPPKLKKTWPMWLQLSAMLFISLGAWFICATAAVFTAKALEPSGSVTALGAVCTVAVAIAGVAACWNPVAAPKATNRVSWKMLAARGGMAALAIFVSVMLSSVSGVMAGVASAFPAIFTTIMLSLSISQGQAVQGGAVGPLVLGSTSVCMYAMTFGGFPSSLLSQPFGAAAAAWVIAVVFGSIPAALFLRWRRSVAAHAAKPLEESTDGGGSTAAPSPHNSSAAKAGGASVLCAAMPTEPARIGDCADTQADGVNVNVDHDGVLANVGETDPTGYPSGRSIAAPQYAAFMRGVQLLGYTASRQPRRLHGPTSMRVISELPICAAQSSAVEPCAVVAVTSASAANNTCATSAC